MTPVIFPLPFSKTFSYKSPDQPIAPGSFVLCPWGKTQKVGVVWPKAMGQKASTTISLKSIDHVYDTLPSLSPSFCEFLQWVATYTMTPLGSIVKMAMPSMDAFNLAKKSRFHLYFHNVSLKKIDKHFSFEQQQAITQLQTSASHKNFAPWLIDGVTGSGKTEVFLEAIDKVLQSDRQVLLLLPEISLSPQLADRFDKRFGFQAALWHSDLTPAHRRETWRGVISGKVKAVIGARSALFLPFQDLGFIVVDEEHSHSFKQEQGVIYHARDMAVVRAKHESCPIALVSATPSLETWLNVEAKRYQVCRLPNRFQGAALPSVMLIDRRLEKKEERQSPWISPLLIQALDQTFTQGEQALLFLNRRGYAPLTLCQSCGHRLACTHCSAWLIYHKFRDCLTCHHCGHLQSIPSSCSNCQEKDSFIPCGPGVERLQEDVQRLYPTKTTLVMTSDTILSPKHLEHSLEQIRDKQVDIIIGTQMMAKGHHFPHLTLVGVIDADMSLMGGDLRATEKTFQLLHQVGGRAGRESKPGFVYLQTYAPDHPVFKALMEHDRDAFMALEQQQRHDSQLPPYSRMAALVLSSLRENELIKYCHALSHAAQPPRGISVLGPAPAPLYKRLDKYRYRFLVECSKDILIQSYITDWLKRLPLPPFIELDIDIDPYTFL